MHIIIIIAIIIIYDIEIKIFVVAVEDNIIRGAGSRTHLDKYHVRTLTITSMKRHHTENVHTTNLGMAST